jgi:hypothetical protein
MVAATDSGGAGLAGVLGRVSLQGAIRMVPGATRVVNLVLANPLKAIAWTEWGVGTVFTIQEMGGFEQFVEALKTPEGALQFAASILHLRIELAAAGGGSARAGRPRVVTADAQVESGPNGPQLRLLTGLTPEPGANDNAIPHRDAPPAAPPVLRTGTDDAVAAGPPRPNLTAIEGGAGGDATVAVASRRRGMSAVYGPPSSPSAFMRAVSIANRGRYRIRSVVPGPREVEASKKYFKTASGPAGTPGKGGQAVHDELNMSPRGADATSRDMVGELKTAELLTQEKLDAAFAQAEGYARQLGLHGVGVRDMEMNTGNIYEFVRQ